MENEKIEEKGLTISDLLFLIKRNIIMILIITLVFVILGAIYGFKIKNPTYTATTTAIVYVDTNTGDSSQSIANNYSYATYFTSTFSTFIKSNPVLNLASKTLQEKYNYDFSRDDLKKSIIVTTETNSLIITVSAKVSAKNDEYGRKAAQAIANTVMSSAIQEANKYKYDDSGNIILDKNGNPEYQYKVLAEKLVVMEEVEELSDVVYRRGATTTVLIAFLIGILISFLIVIIKYFTNDTFTSKEAYEEATGLNVLSVISAITQTGGKK